MINFWAILAAVIVVFAAPLVLGTYVVVQRASLPATFAWFAAIAGLLCVTLGAGVALLVLAPL